MTTENNTRTLEELLRLNTYQGMTDEEIEIIMEHERNKAYSKGNMDAVQSQSFIHLQQYHTANMALVERCSNMIESYEREHDALLNGVNS